MGQEAINRALEAHNREIAGALQRLAQATDRVSSVHLKAAGYDALKAFKHVFRHGLAELPGTVATATVESGPIGNEGSNPQKRCLRTQVPYNDTYRVHPTRRRS